MGTEFASAGLTAGQLNAIVKKLGGFDAALRFLRDELIVSEPATKWREECGIIYLAVTSDGTTGPQWIERLRKIGFNVSSYAQDVLRSKDFLPTTNITYQIAVLKGARFKDNDRTVRNIRNEAKRRHFNIPNAEIACLIREKFSDENIETMGFYWIVAMHELIKDSVGDPGLLSAGRLDDGRWLSTCCGRPDCRWLRDYGFAFAVSQAQV